MAAITAGSTKSTSNGVTAVTCVAAPAAATKRTVLAIRIPQIDTVDRAVTLQKNINGTKHMIEKITGLAPGSIWRPVARDLIVNLVDTTESLEFLLDAAPATNQLICQAEWIDKS